MWDKRLTIQMSQGGFQFFFIYIFKQKVSFTHAEKKKKSKSALCETQKKQSRDSNEQLFANKHITNRERCPRLPGPLQAEDNTPTAQYKAQLVLLKQVLTYTQWCGQTAAAAEQV